ncbi:MAG TPA: hypothetical protein VIM55_11095 [Mucilaginibacter sp.]
MMRIKLFLIIACVIIMAGCKPNVKPEAVYGKWRYIKIEHNHNDPPEIGETELKKQQASIEFTKDSKFTIMWGGRPLSHGTFMVDEDKIQITEILPDNTMRKFPFYVTELSDNKIVFETRTGVNPKVTAVRE